jgi:hypothetical protein
MGDTARVLMAVEGKVGREAPDGGRSVLARQVSSLAQYAAERERGGEEMRAGVIDVDMGVRRLSSAARGDIAGFSILLTRQDGVEVGAALLSPPAGKIGDDAVLPPCVPFPPQCQGVKREDAS